MSVATNHPTERRFRAYRVHREGDDTIGALAQLAEGDLPPGEVTVEVAYSSLNYKDALSARGRPGVTRHYPHTPGIDAAGTVVRSSDPRHRVGDAVIVTSYDLGMGTAGGFAELIRVPADWVVPLPTGLTLRESMIMGTAGLTAGLALDALEQHGFESAHGPVVVTGASGGVGSLAVAILAERGYHVVASSGTASAGELLLKLGAAEVIDRRELGEPAQRAMLKTRFAGAVDTVGGPTLVNVVKSLRYGGAAVACGLVGGADLPLNVFPFILRGVALLGVDTAELPMARRERIWGRLAADWKPEGLNEIATEIGLQELDEAVDRILAGRTVGRILVRVAD